MAKKKHSTERFVTCSRCGEHRSHFQNNALLKQRKLEVLFGGASMLYYRKAL
jgi:hypothetical protein